MAFKFSLSTVLKFRETVEEKELLSLQRMQQQACAIREEIERIHVQSEVATRLLGERLLAGMSAFQLRCAREHVELLKHARGQFEKLLSENQRQQGEQTRQYLRSRSDRETVTEIRERARRDYRKEQDRREQSVLDDVFGARLLRGK